MRIAMVCNGWSLRKNSPAALRAFGQFHRAHAHAELHMFGFDSARGEAAEQWCKQHGLLSGVQFHGVVPHALLLERLANLDLLLHPSLEESFGMAVAEAMALGLPVVAGESSGAVPWVVGDAGVLCDVRHPLEIARALRRAFAPEHYGRLSALGIKRSSERFTVSAVAERYLEIYQTAIREQQCLGKATKRN
jgi:glycosyltransferase involved in cell wall biosynthesis